MTRSDCMDVQASLALYWWQRLITFASSRIKVKNKIDSEIFYLYRSVILTLMLLEPKDFATNIQSGQPAHLYYLSSFHLDIPKNDNGQFQNWNVDYSI